MVSSNYVQDNTRILDHDFSIAIELIDGSIITWNDLEERFQSNHEAEHGTSRYLFFTDCPTLVKIRKSSDESCYISFGIGDGQLWNYWTGGYSFSGEETEVLGMLISFPVWAVLSNEYCPDGQSKGHTCMLIFSREHDHYERKGFYHAVLTKECFDLFEVRELRVG
jgi:hypothetical protein